MLCPLRHFFCAIQPYNNHELFNTANLEKNYNCIYSAYGDYNKKYRYTSMKISKPEMALSNTMRMLWEQHIVWTRMTIISIIAGLADVDFVTRRLLRNPVDFEKALSPLYGDRISSKFRDLFKSHLIIASELVKAAKAGNKKAAANAEKRWYTNADEIAVFLGKINPYWSQSDWQKMLHEHLALTKSETVDILTGNYEEGINLYDQIEKQALKMADVMTKGIIRQFPEKFIR